MLLHGLSQARFVDDSIQNIESFVSLWVGAKTTEEVRSVTKRRSRVDHHITGQATHNQQQLLSQNLA